VLLNQGFVTGLVALAGLGATGWLLRRQTEPLVFKIGELAPGPKLRLAASLLGLLGVFLYLVAYSPAVMRLLEMHFLFGEAGGVGFAFHYLALALAAGLLALLYRQRESLLRPWPQARKPLLWLLCLAVVYISSAELIFHVVYLHTPVVNLTLIDDYDQYTGVTEAFWARVRQVNKVGFPILWGVCAFVFMFVGLRQKNRSLRIVALTLFTLTLTKLFVYDIRGISEGGKIAAFIFLGVLLLVISFMYQNLKQLILAEEPAVTAEE
jgi:hypothetical protein